MRSQVISVVFAVCLISMSCFAPRAEACTRLPEVDIRGFDSLPATGSLVPRSTVIWVRSNRGTVGNPQLVRLMDAKGRSWPLTTTSVRVAGETPSTLFVFRPSALLDANTQYRVELSGLLLSEFSTSEDIDTQPPALPKARLIAVRGTSSSETCFSTSSLSVSLESPGDVNFLVSSEFSSATMPSTALAVAGFGASLIANSISSGAHDLRVIAFDLSGNMAMGPDRLSASVPSEGVGCSSAGGGPLTLALVFAAWRRHRGRGRQNR